VELKLNANPPMNSEGAFMWQLISRVLLFKSFLLGVLVLCLWLRSYHVGDAINFQSSEKSIRLASAKGLMIYRVEAVGSIDVALSDFHRNYKSYVPDSLIWELPVDRRSKWGFSYSSESMFGDGTGLALYVTIPYWFLFFLLSSKAIVWMLFRPFRTDTDDDDDSPQMDWCPTCQADQPVKDNHCLTCGGPTGDSRPPINAA
jgi:hypothetical protein